MKYIIITTTFEIEVEAKKIATDLLDKHLIACGQIGKIESLYNWKNERFDTQEYILTMKTREVLFSEIERHIKQNHSYDVAEIVTNPIVNISKEYAKWIDENTKE